jgi:hypothetical protein
VIEVTAGLSQSIRLPWAYARGGRGSGAIAVVNGLRFRVYAATGSSTIPRVIAGSTLTPGPIVEAKVTERM